MQPTAPALRTVHVTRYVTPLREGGSLPAIVEADDDGMYVLKFRGAGQGAKALVAELICGGIARAIGLPVPDIVLAELDPQLARTEPDPEIQELLRASAGTNLALDYLPGSITFDPQADAVDEKLASRIVWFDAYVMNIDRSARNANLLTWHRRLWLIDHGAALYVHHGADDWPARNDGAFAGIKDHVLLPRARDLAAADADMQGLLTPDILASVVAQIPPAWLETAAPQASADAQRNAYLEFLSARLARSAVFVEEAQRARAALI